MSRTSSIKLILLFILLIAWTVVGYVVLNRMSANVAINFYGRVVDEHNHGLPGVHISARVIYGPIFQLPIPWSDNQRFLVIDTMSDDQGNFSFTNLKGEFLDLQSFDAPGLALENLGAGYDRGFKYSQSGGNRGIYPPTDPHKPYIYPMVPEAVARQQWKDRVLNAGSQGIRQTSKATTRRSFASP